MAFKVCLFFALVAVANCGFIGSPYVQYAAPQTIVKTIAPAPTIVKQVRVEPAPAPVQYQFQYEVNNPETGDIKSQEESRTGDDVKGSYSLVEPDGLNRRIVEYTASEEGGFNAVVRREPLSAPVVVKKIIAPAPTITKVIAPAPAYTKVISSAPAVYPW